MELMEEPHKIHNLLCHKAHSITPTSFFPPCDLKTHKITRHRSQQSSWHLPNFFFSAGVSWENNHLSWCCGQAPKEAEFWMEMSAERFMALLLWCGCQRGHVCVDINRIYGTITVKSSALIQNTWHSVQVEVAFFPGLFNGAGGLFF